MPIITVPHTFADGPGNPASGEEINENNEAILDVVNGFLDTANIDPATEIAILQLRVTGATDGIRSTDDLYYRAEGGDHYFISTLGSWGTCHAAAYTVESDESGKTAIKPLKKGALEAVKGLQGVTFKRKGENARSAGLIAQDVKEVLPEATVTKVRKADPDNTEPTIGIDIMGVVGLLTEAVKELSAKVEALEAK